jgi:hypothetical protein
VNRTTLIFISIWLFVSFPFNVATLKHVTRGIFWLTAHLDAGLDRYNWLQYSLAAVFVSWASILLSLKVKMGRTFAIGLLLGSCGGMLAHVSIDFLLRKEAPRHWLLMGVIVLFNIAALCELRERA